MGFDTTIDPAVAEYIAALEPGHRALFERVHALVLEVCPSAEVLISYKMPTYRVGKRSLHVGAWAHGVSIYGWKAKGDAGFTARHPELKTSTGTIRLRPEQAVAISDEEFRSLARAVLVP
jgi:uncharacterized protein YdhG (YjbR/CyaY superfamily)